MSSNLPPRLLRWRIPMSILPRLGRNHKQELFFAKFDGLTFGFIEFFGGFAEIGFDGVGGE
jgi:hypothetical protein